MLVVTIGTSFPFDRLLDSVARIRTDEPILVQRGHSTWRADGVECSDFWPFPILIDHVRRARLVITHAGVGSILMCLQNGKRPIVTARLRRFGEAVDDHQLELAHRLHEAGLVTLVEDLRRLPAVVADSTETDIRPANARSLVDDLRAYLRDRVRAVAAARTS